MKQGTGPVHTDRNGYQVTIDNVPACVCQQCGEAYFEEREFGAIQDLIRNIQQKANEQ
jgi:YgiT-type zinc finger domain-containing protein